MSETIVGTRIREYRRQMGVTQAEMARRVGISASYLNLIERNKRRIAGALLRTVADNLGVSLEDLDGASERRLVETLREVASRPALAGQEVELDALGDLVGRYPGWARAIAAIARSEEAAQHLSRALSDRLTHDPFLGEAVHRMLTRVAAIRSAAEILIEFEDIDEDARRRFNRIVHDEAHVLTEVGEALAVYFDQADESGAALTPQDEVEALFNARRNSFAELEQPGSEDAQTDARVRQIVEGTPGIDTDLARARATQRLHAYARRAALMPMQDFVSRAAELGYDIDALAEALELPHEEVFLRLTALPTNESVPEFGYMRANAAGTIIEMLGLEGLELPRFTGACPLWILFRAQQAGETVQCQRVVFPSGLRFVFVARARNTAPPGFRRPRHYVTDMLTMREEDATRTVYGPDETTPVEEVGPACRLCPRTACLHRVEDPLTG